MYTYLICLSDLVWNTWQIQTRVSGKTVWWVDHFLKMACCEKNIEDNVILLYLSGSLCPSIVLFSGRYLNVRPTKFKGPFNWNLSLLFELRINILLTLSLPDQICHSPYCQPYNYYKVSSENLILDQLIIPKLTFFFILITYLPGGWYGIDIVLILYWYCKEKFSLGHSRVKCCFLSLYYLYKLGSVFFALNLGP